MNDIALPSAQLQQTITIAVVPDFQHPWHQYHMQLQACRASCAATTAAVLQQHFWTRLNCLTWLKACIRYCLRQPACQRSSAADVSHMLMLLLAQVPVPVPVPVQKKHTTININANIQHTPPPQVNITPNINVQAPPHITVPIGKGHPVVGKGH